MQTDQTGASVVTCTSLPFGDNQSCAGTDYNAMHFTGEERDSETRVDHFLFRQYSSGLSRWMVPDPAGMAAADPGNPQSWNRYAYGSGVKTRSKMVDTLLLVGAALLVAGLSTGAALLSEAYHVSPAWLLSFWAGVVFSGWLERRMASESSNHRASPRSQQHGW